MDIQDLIELTVPIAELLNPTIQCNYWSESIEYKDDTLVIGGKQNDAWVQIRIFKGEVKSIIPGRFRDNFEVSRIRVDRNYPEPDDAEVEVVEEFTSARAAVIKAVSIVLESFADFMYP